MHLKGSGVIVTGGASGLGLATAILLQSAGARVGVLDIAESGEWSGPFAKADVSSEVEVREAMAALKPAIGNLRGMVNLAGGSGSGLCVGEDATLTVEKFRRSLEVNTLGSFIVTTLAAEEMRNLDPDENGERGVIINTSSIVAMEGQLGTAGYAAAKGGINAMTLPLAREFARFGIRVMTIAPGIFETPMFRSAGKSLGDMNAWLRQQVQFPARPGIPDEFAAFAKHILENPMFNGEVVRLDGAYRVPPGTPKMWTG